CSTCCSSATTCPASRAAPSSDRHRPSWPPTRGRRHMNSSISLGACLWSQASDWPAFLAAARRADELGFDHIWTWDHLLPIFGDTDQPIWEGYVALGALGVATSRAKLGLLVGANTFRNPGVVARSVLTLDHVSGGRAIMG